MRKYILGIMMSLLALTALQSCADGQKVTSINQHLNAAEFKSKVENQHVVLLDIRTVEEFESGAISGAKNIDWYDSETFQSEVSKLDKNQPVYMYCASGNRSGQALELMNGMGFTQVYHLQGGIGAWRRAGYPLK